MKAFPRFVSAFVAFAVAAGFSVTATEPAQAASVTNDAKKAFIAKLLPAAQSSQQQFGVPASVSIAQAIEASDWGTAKPATSANNYFNTTCSAGMTATQFAALADAQIGKPYVLGAEASITNPNPPKFDCSELVEWLYGRSGNKITDLAASQYNVTKAVAATASPKVGDLVFLRNNPARSNGIGHVAVVTRKLDNGDWRIIEAKGKAYGVVATTLSYWKTRAYYAGLRRYPTLVFAGSDGVTASAANVYQTGCVTIDSTKYAKFASIADSFSAHSLAVLNDSSYATSRGVLNNVSAYLAAVAAAERPKTAEAYATELTKLIDTYKLRDYDVTPFTWVLDSGDANAKVTALQHLLTDAGYTVKVTGTYDSATVAAVKKYQTAKKLEVDGEAGPITLTTLVGKLESGASGAQVSAVHSLLAANGYATDAGGTFGATTVQSVKAFQASIGAAVTGVVDGNTWAAFFMILDPAPVPKVTGAAKVGSVLTATPGTWGPSTVTLSYQWYRGTTAIPGATKSTYTLQAADAGSAVKAVVTGRKATYTTTARSSAPTATVPLLAFTATPKPKITGKAVPAQVLTATPGTWGPSTATLSYQWYRGTTAIPGATKATYTVTAADGGAALKVIVTGSQLGYASSAQTSAATAAVPLSVVGTKPTISGEAVVGKTLTAQAGTWGPEKVTLSYQWYRGTAAISKATGATYLVTAADAGKALSVKVTGGFSGYLATTLQSASTAAVKTTAAPAKITGTGVKISGTAKPGKKLSVKAGSWGPSGVKLSYRWYVNGKAIKGATGKTYQVKSADKGRRITVKVTGTKTGLTALARTATVKIS